MIGNEYKASNVLSTGQADVYMKVLSKTVWTSGIIIWFHWILVGAMVGMVPGGPESCSKWVE